MNKFKETDSPIERTPWEIVEKSWPEKANTIEQVIEQFEEDIPDQKPDKALFMMEFDKVVMNRKKNCRF